MKKILLFLKQWMLLIAIVVGAVGHSFFSQFSALSPVLLVSMLLLTYSNLANRDLRFHPLLFLLLALQIAGGLLCYAVIDPLHPLLAQSACLCILAPTATAAATITLMLGGNLGFTVAYTLLSSMAVVVDMPLIVPVMAQGVDLSFLEFMLNVFSRVAPLMLCPLIFVLALKRYAPKAHKALQKKSFLTFYIWAIMLLILMGNTFEILMAPGKKDYVLEIMLAGVGIVICGIQFIIGKSLGSRFHRRIAAGQALGQKNLLFTMWITFQYLDATIYVALAFYSVMQNSINSVQIWLQGRRNQRIADRIHAQRAIRRQNK